MDISKPHDDVLKKILSCDYTRIPVYRNTLEDIIGVINVKEVFNTYLRSPKNVKLESLIKPAYFALNIWNWPFVIQIERLQM